MFFHRVKNLLNMSRLSDVPDLASRTWNCDETVFCTAVASKAVLTRRGAKQVHETAGGSGRDYITVLGMLNMLIESTLCTTFYICLLFCGVCSSALHKSIVEITEVREV